MGEAFGDDDTLRGLLQRVVADRGGGAHGFLDIAGFKPPGIVLGPDAGEAIGLEFDAH